MLNLIKFFLSLLSFDGVNVRFCFDKTHLITIFSEALKFFTFKSKSKEKFQMSFYALKGKNSYYMIRTDLEDEDSFFW